MYMMKLEDGIVNVKDAGDSCYNFAWAPCVFAHVVSRGTDGFCPQLDFQVNSLG